MPKVSKTKPTLEKLKIDLHSQYAYLYAKPSRKQKMNTNTVSKMQKFIASKLMEPKGHILDEAFITNFRLLKEIDSIIFVSMTKTLYEVLITQPIRYDFLKKLVTEWVDYANCAPMATKERLFFEHFNIFQSMAKFIPKIGCYSLQTQILKIIFSHLKEPHGHVKALFMPLIKDEWFFTQFKSYNERSDLQKHIIMYRDLPNFLNRNSKHVYSKVMRYLYIDDEPIDPYPSHEGFSDWNRGTKTVEFSITFKGTEAKATIDCVNNVESLQYDICSQTNTVCEITFIMKEPLSLDYDPNAILSDKPHAKKVKMMFDAFEADVVEMLVLEMIPGLVMSKTNGKVKMGKPTLNVIQTRNRVDIFSSTPQKNPKIPNHMNDLSKFFENTEYTTEEVKSQRFQKLDYSNSDIKSEKMMSKPAASGLKLPTKANKKQLRNSFEVASNGQKNQASSKKTAKIQPNTHKPLAVLTDQLSDAIELHSDETVRNVNLHIKTELTNQAIVIQEYKPKNRKRRKSSVELRPKKTAKIEYTKPRSVTKPGSTKINPMNPPSIKRYEFEDSEESTKLPEPQNVALQFDSLFAGPFCFKGQVKPNAKVLHKKLLTALKNNSNQTYTLDDSD